MSPWPRIRRQLKAFAMRRIPGMMTCREFEAFVLAYHEGELDGGARRRFEWHMRQCRPCRVGFTHYCRAVRVGQRLFAAEATAPVDERLVASILRARRDG